MSHIVLEKYLSAAESDSPGIVVSLRKSILEFSEKYLKSFSFNEHKTGLLFGHVQSGKTSQMFGVIAAAVDQGFKVFVLLTNDNIFLQKQTLQRAFRTLDSLNICDESDYLRFREGGLRKPSLVILKKNQKVLRTWRNHIASASFVKEQAIFIVDDEGDAASLNTKVNIDEQSEINRLIGEIKNLAPSSLYLQVTATPQALVLQAINSSWRPSFAHFFEPGPNYLGGRFFYSDTSSPIRLTDENEAAFLLRTHHPPEGLRKAMLFFLISGINLLARRRIKTLCFLIHPSTRILHHDKVRRSVEELRKLLLRDLSSGSGTLRLDLEDAWKDLAKTATDLIPFEECLSSIQPFLKAISVVVLNSRSPHQTQFSEGLNIVIGGNTLGRGLTIPGLHVVYYCRSTRTPQVDTSWQHSRIFGYDREGAYCRIFLPPSLAKLFRGLNEANESLFTLLRTKGVSEVSLLTPVGARPTRRSVVKQSDLAAVQGGVNYFANFPSARNTQKLDKLLGLADGERLVTIDEAISVTRLAVSENKDDWDADLYVSCILSIKGTGQPVICRLIVRNDRSISKGTGTLLSPDDRNLANSYPNDLVMVFYRIRGERNKGWNGQPLWVPNIKFPAGKLFSRIAS